MNGLALETATGHVEVAVVSPDGVLAHRVEDVGHGHTRRLAALVREALAEANVAPRSLRWVAADLGPGSFTGVRVGLATAQALALAAGAEVLGASSLAALAHAAPARRSLVVPLVGAGRRDVYAGFFRVDPRGRVAQLAAPRVLHAEALIEAIEEARAVLPDHAVRCVGPGAGRERDRIEAAYPTATAQVFRHGGLSALDLAQAARLGLGPGAGLPLPGRPPLPVYVRPAQAEERVRHAVMGLVPVAIRDTVQDDVPALLAIERQVFGDPWSESFFRSLIADPNVWSRVAERPGGTVGYGFAALRPPHAELENLAVAPGRRREGVARALLADLFGRCRAEAVRDMTLEVRVSNDAAQALYRAHGFRMAGVRRSYYQAPLEDALILRAAL